MARVVFKNPLPLPGSRQDYPICRIGHDLPIVYVNWQAGIPMFWFETVDNHNPQAVLSIWCVGTGHLVPNDQSKHVGTLIDPGGFVWHYYAEWR